VAKSRYGLRAVEMMLKGVGVALTTLALRYADANVAQIKADIEKLIPMTLMNQTFLEMVRKKAGDDSAFEHEHIHVSGNLDLMPGGDRGLMMEGDRAILNSDLLFLFEDIQAYGCWCYFGEIYQQGLGAGHPQSDLDAMCKQLSDGYTCAYMDANTADRPKCEPYNVEYQSGYTGVFEFFGDQGPMEFNCRQRNADQCQYEACVIEGTFIRELLLEVSINSFPTNSPLKHSLGFDPTTGCKKKHGGNSERHCCGEIPNRFPFSTRENTHQCCGQSIFDVNMFVCCDDSTVQFSCL